MSTTFRKNRNALCPVKRSQIAAQLYTVRDFCQSSADLSKTLGQLSAIGYQAVECISFESIEPAEVKALCAEHGLTITSTHVASELIRERPECAVEMARALDCRYAVYPYPAGVDFNDEGSVSALIADLAHASQVLAEAGCALAYHNHQHEFVRVGGRVLLEKIYEELSIQAEIDTYWTQFGGSDPAAWCRQLTGRLPLLHLKDYRINAEMRPDFAEIGQGNLDFVAIVQAADEAGCAWFIVEQDTCPGDPFESLKLSFDHLVEHLVES